MFEKTQKLDDKTFGDLIDRSLPSALVSLDVMDELISIIGCPEKAYAVSRIIAREKILAANDVTTRSLIW